MISRRPVIAGALMWFVAAEGASTQSSPTEVVLGLVEVPKLFGPPLAPMDPEPRRSPGRVVLRREPGTRSPVVATLTSSDSLDAGEIAHRWGAANVYQRANGWSRVRLSDGQTGWISPADSGAFHPLERLIRDYADQLFLYDGSWNRLLRSEPGGGEAIVVPRDHRKRFVGYLEGVGPLVRVEAGATAEAIRERLHGGNAATITRSDGARFVEFMAGTEVPVFSAPSTASAIVASVKNHWGGFELHTGDAYRVVVFSRRPGWFEVVLADPGKPLAALRRAWVEDRPDAWRFIAAPAIESDGFAYPSDPAEHGIRVIEHRNVGGRLWLRVQLMLDSDCTRTLENITEPPTVLAEGWLPAHDDVGQPRVGWNTYCD